MAKRKAQRIETLLALRRQQEHQARLAFQQALGEAEAAARRLVELDLQLAARSRQARGDLFARRPAGGGEAYRAGASELMGEIGQYRSELRRLDGSLDRRRRQLADATRDRQAIERMHERIVAAKQAARERAAAAETGDRHAARATAAAEVGA